MSDHGKLDELLGEYWNAAYTEGVEGRHHDTVDSAAQRTLNSIHAEVEKQLAERDAALARCVEALEMSLDWLSSYPGFGSENAYNKARAALASLPASAQATAKVLAECRWTPDLYGVWETGCGEAFVLNDGTPKQNGMVFCPYCGKAIREENEGK